MTPLQDAIKTLHARKNRAYGSAWKRRGERISVLPNIARKIDRLVVFANTKAEMQDEPVVDTAIDLLVYCGKYLLFLADLDSALISRLAVEHPRFPLSDQVENLDQLVDAAQFGHSSELDLTDLIFAIESTFEILWPLADTASTPAERFELAGALWRDAVLAVGIIVREKSQAVDQFVRHESEIARENI